LGLLIIGRIGYLHALTG